MGGFEGILGGGRMGFGGGLGDLRWGGFGGVGEGIWGRFGALGGVLGVIWGPKPQIWSFWGANGGFWVLAAA